MDRFARTPPRHDGSGRLRGPDQVGRSSAAWAATVGWAVLFYLGCVAVIVTITADQATWGHFIVWPSLSAVAGLAACATVGFTAGRLLPGRLTSPLAAVGVFAMMALGMESAIHGSGFGFLSPIYPALSLNSSVFYATGPDLALVQIAFDLGVTAALLGVIALRDFRGVGTGLAAAGLALALGAAVMASGSRLERGGVLVPLLDGNAPAVVAYLPVCSQGRAVQVCVHPAYSGELNVLTATIGRLAAPLVDTPALPARAEQSSSVDGDDGVRSATVQVRFKSFISQGGTITPPAQASQFSTEVALQLVTSPSTPFTDADPAQRAVALFLLRQAGYAPSRTAGPDKAALLPADASIDTAARRLAALAPAARHSWLNAHIKALQSGTLTLGELP